MKRYGISGVGLGILLLAGATALAQPMPAGRRPAGAGGARPAPEPAVTATTRRPPPPARSQQSVGGPALPALQPKVSQAARPLEAQQQQVLQTTARGAPDPQPAMAQKGQKVRPQASPTPEGRQAMAELGRLRTCRIACLQSNAGNGMARLECFDRCVRQAGFMAPFPLFQSCNDQAQACIRRVCPSLSGAPGPVSCGDCGTRRRDCKASVLANAAPSDVVAPVAPAEAAATSAAPASDSSAAAAPSAAGAPAAQGGATPSPGELSE